jgi:hypothetical protein
LRLTVSGVPASAHVAWELGEAGSRLSGRSIELSLARPGWHALSAVWITEDGGVHRVRRELRVRTARASGCAAAPAADPGAAASLLFGGASLLKRRRRGGPGNRLRAAAS